MRPLPVQTQGKQLLKLFIQIYYINSHQQYENVTSEVSHSSILKYHNGLSIINSYNKHKTHKQKHKTAGAVILQLALKLQKGNNFSVIPIQSEFYLRHDYIISSTRHREIVEIELHPENDTKWFIKAKNKCKGILNKKTVMIWTSTFKRTLLHLHLNFTSMFEQTFQQTFSISTDITI